MNTVAFSRWDLKTEDEYETDYYFIKGIVSFDVIIAPVSGAFFAVGTGKNINFVPTVHVQIVNVH